MGRALLAVQASGGPCVGPGAKVPQLLTSFQVIWQECLQRAGISLIERMLVLCSI